MRKVFKKSNIAQFYYYDPQSTINLQSPQSDSTPWTLTLVQGLVTIYITILQVKTYIVAPLEGKSHTTSSTIGVMT